MTNLGDALKALKAVHARHEIPGDFLASPDVSIRWPSELPGSAELDVFYSEYEPRGVRIETGFTPLRLFDMAALNKAQTGYRWINSIDGPVLSDEWPSQHVVIMDDMGGGKPIIAVTNTYATPVFASYDVVEPFQIAESLADFIFALSRLIDIVYGEFDIFDVADDDGISTAFMARLNSEITPVLGEANKDRFVDYFYG